MTVSWKIIKTQVDWERIIQKYYMNMQGLNF